jgi:4-amino-4-deoxy-L-arabinose transferase-like glycosyltransferase
MRSGRAWRVLVPIAIAATAITLRVWRLGWGLDEGLLFPDELLFTTRAQAFWPLSWGSFALEELTYPALYGYLGGLVAALLHAIAWLGPPRIFSVDTVFVLRAVSAAAGVVNVALVGLLGARLYSPRVGLGAAALLAVVPLDAMQVHYASVDVLFAACATLTMLATLALARRGTAASALLAGGAAGLAFAAKYTGAVLLATVAWGVIESAARTRSVARALTLGAGAGAGFLAAAALGCPPCVLHRQQLLTALHIHELLSSRYASISFPNNHLAPTLGWYGHP